MSGDHAVRQSDGPGHASAAGRLVLALILLAPFAICASVAGASASVDGQLSSLAQAVYAKSDVIGAPTQMFAGLPMIGAFVVRIVSACVPAVVAGVAIALIWVIRRRGLGALTSEDNARTIAEVAAALTGVLFWKPVAAGMFGIGAKLIAGTSNTYVIALVAGITTVAAVLAAAAMIGLLTWIATDGFRDPVCFPSIGDGDLSAFIAPGLVAGHAGGPVRPTEEAGAAEHGTTSGDESSTETGKG